MSSALLQSFDENYVLQVQRDGHMVDLSEKLNHGLLSNCMIHRWHILIPGIFEAFLSTTFYSATLKYLGKIPHYYDT